MTVSTSKLNEGKSHVNEHGLGWLMASVFIIGDMAGGGMIALPNAFSALGIIPGIILVVLCAIFSGYTGIQLSHNWNMLQQRWPLYRESCRKPYGEMAYRAVGPRARSLTAVLICVTQFGFATVLILLAAKNVSILLNFFFHIQLHTCYLIIIVGLVVWPATMLKSPMHFWQVAVFSAASSSVAVALVFIGMMHDATECSKDVPHEPTSLIHFCMAYGTLVFAFGGHAAFPTIQHDMRKPAHFVHSVILAYIVITVFYLSVSIGGFFVYGSTVGEAVIPSVQVMWIQQTVNIMISLHVITTIVIVFSPMVQQVEQKLNVPHKFGWKRFFVRSVLFWLVIFVALSLPKFGPMMDLIGASTMSLMTMILPSIFYLSLRASTEIRKRKILSGETKETEVDDDKPTIREIFEYVPKPILAFNALSLTFGMIGAILATIASIVKLSGSDMDPPCYIQLFKTGLPFVGGNNGMVNCCGSFANVTVSDIAAQGFCSPTKI